MILLFYSHVRVMKEVQSYTPKTYSMCSLCLLFAINIMKNSSIRWCFTDLLSSLGFVHLLLSHAIMGATLASVYCTYSQKHFVLAVACQICSFRAWLCRAMPLKGKCCSLITPTICYCSSSIPPPIFSYRLPPFPHPHFLVNCWVRKLLCDLL